MFSPQQSSIFLKKGKKKKGRRMRKEKIELYVLSLLTEVITPNLPILVGYKMKERVHEVGEDRELGRW